jgi:hypothetical protein
VREQEERGEEHDHAEVDVLLEATVEIARQDRSGAGPRAWRVLARVPPVLVGEIEVAIQDDGARLGVVGHAVFRETGHHQRDPYDEVEREECPRRKLEW